MAAATYKIKDQYKGDTFSGVRFTMKNKSDNTPVNLTGASVLIQFKRRYKRAPVVQYEINNGNGITIEDATNGIFVIDSFLIDWPPTVYYYDIQITFPSGDIKTYIKGTLTVLQDTTNN